MSTPFNGIAVRRRGSTTVLSAVCMAIVMMIAAFAVDIGFILIAKADLQRSADAAAQSAVLDYRNEGSLDHILQSVRDSAKAGVEANPILRDVATVDLNQGNSDLNGDVLLGRIDLAQSRAPMTLGPPSEFNAVKVSVRRSLTKNGTIPLFFGRIFGYQELELEATATAALIRNVSGFKIPTNGENLPILPLTISVEDWENQLNSGLSDNWSFDTESQKVSDLPDNIPEVVLFPNDIESSGNFGTVRIGTSNNSTKFLGNQIRNGLSQNDLDFHGGQLKLDSNSRLTLGGNPGISAGIKDDLAKVTGQVKIIPIYDTVTGNGSNAEYSIVRFEAIRIMAVKLSGGEKFVAVQPARISLRGVIQSSTSGTSSRIFSPPIIVQ